MKKLTLVLALVIVAAVIVGLSACGGAGPTPQPTPTSTVSGSAVKAASKIVAEGKVVPARNASLSFQTGGLVKEVAVVQGDRVEAGKVIAQLDTKQLELQLAQADANVVSAQAKLAQVKRGPLPEEIAAAQQNLKSAQTAHDGIVKPPANDIAVLKADLDKTQAALDQATAAYNAVGGDNNPQSGMLPQRLQVQSAWIDYQRAQTLYNAKLNPTNAQVQQALAAVENARNALAKLQPTAEDIAAAQAGVTAAQAARDVSAQQLANAKLVTPFAGTVTTLDLRVGEYAAPGVAVLRLSDASKFQVETTDLTELNIVNIQEGDAVTVSFDAIPEMVLGGKVMSIKGYGENRQGDIVYTVTVGLDQQDPHLRWNMTAKVTIAPKN